jgi:hypothetical protein
MQLPPEILAQIFSRLDNESLLVISRTPLWFVVRDFARDELFWKMRVENLYRLNLNHISGVGWKGAYYFYCGDMSIPNLLMVDLLIYTRFDFKISNYRPLRDAARDGNLEVIQELWNIATSDNNKIPGRILYAVVGNAIKSKSIPTVRFLLSDSRYADYTILTTVCSDRGEFDMVKLALEYTKKQNSIEELSYVLQSYIERDEAEIVQLLLREYPGSNRLGLGIAVRALLGGHHDVALLLFYNSRLFWPLILIIVFSLLILVG